jgi:serine/threonine protein kinase
MEPLEAGDPRQVGVYRLHFRLGSGGMGRVYLGFSPAGRAVAVKIVHPDLARDHEFVQRFRREVRAAEAVSGAYTAPVVAAGPDDARGVGRGGDQPGRRDWHRGEQRG